MIVGSGSIMLLLLLLLLLPPTTITPYFRPLALVNRSSMSWWLIRWKQFILVL
jgi:hypothetical protein